MTLFMKTRMVLIATNVRQNAYSKAAASCYVTLHEQAIVRFDDCQVKATLKHHVKLIVWKWFSFFKHSFWPIRQCFKQLCGELFMQEILDTVKLLVFVYQSYRSVCITLWVTIVSFR